MESGMGLDAHSSAMEFANVSPKVFRGGLKTRLCTRAVFSGDMNDKKEANKFPFGVDTFGKMNGKRTARRYGERIVPSELESRASPMGQHFHG